MTLGEVLAHGDDPGVVGRRRGEPQQVVFLAVEGCDFGFAARPVLPRGIVLQVEEQRAVPGVFGVDVDLPRQNGSAHDVRRAQLQLVLEGETTGFEQAHDHVAEQCPLGVDLRCDNDPALGRARCDRQGGDEQCCDRDEHEP